MRRERERKEQELKRSPKVEFVSGGTQPGVVVPPTKFSLPIPGLKKILTVDIDFMRYIFFVASHCCIS
jgi:hypothetical protein